MSEITTPLMNTVSIDLWSRILTFSHWRIQYFVFFLKAPYSWHISVCGLWHFPSTSCDINVLPKGGSILQTTTNSLVLYEPSTYLQLVFAETGEAISGGNFHGEYPAKVKSLNTELTNEIAAWFIAPYPLLTLVSSWSVWVMVFGLAEGRTFRRVCS